MLQYFWIYYAFTVVMVMLAFTRIQIYSTFLWVLSRSETAKKFFLGKGSDSRDKQNWILEEISRLTSQSVVYFVNHTSLSHLNRAIQYIEDNEKARCVRVVHVCDEDDPAPQYLMECVRMLDMVYTQMRL